MKLTGDKEQEVCNAHAHMYTLLRKMEEVMAGTSLN